jgi:hypothetical protein
MKTQAQIPNGRFVGFRPTRFSPPASEDRLAHVRVTAKFKVKIGEDGLQVLHFFS